MEILRAPEDSHDLTLGTTSVADNIPYRGGTLIQLTGVIATTSIGQVTWRWSPDVIKDPDFEDYKKTWAGVLGTIPNKDDASTTNTYDTAGAILKAGGPWIERGTSGAITLGKASPLVATWKNLRSAVIAMDSAATRLVQGFMLKAATAYTLYLNHLDDDSNITLDFAITERTAAGALKYVQSGGTWTTAAYWRNVAYSGTDAQATQTFTSDEKTIYEILFRVTPADVGAYTTNLDRVFIAEDALATDVELSCQAIGTSTVPSVHPAPYIFRAPTDGRVVAKASADTPSLNICRVGPR